MRSFGDVYADAVEIGEEVSPELLALLQGVYTSVTSGAGPGAVKPAVTRLLEYLTSPAGRTDAHCRAVDFFFCLGDWNWDALPPGYQELFADMGGGLHEAVSAPDIAEALDATPEVLLHRARALPPRR